MTAGERVRGAGAVVQRGLLSVSIAAILAAPLGAHAQEPAGLGEIQNPSVFLERSYFSPLTPTGKDVILEGQASPHFWIRNTLTDRTWLREGGWKWLNVPVSMMLAVRIFDDFSSPVRTPSFEIRPAYVQAFHLERERDERGGRFRLFGVAIGATHHSNGQAGCTFRGQSFDGVECVVADASLFGRRELNTTDGSFSTNFFELDLGVRWGALDNNARLDRQLSVRVEAEAHPLELAKGGLERTLAEEYGQYLLAAAVEVEKHFEDGIGRAELRNQVRFGGVKDDGDYAGQLEASWLLHRAENVGFFARLHWGSDYYNIHFQNTETFFQVGLMWDPGRLDQFTRRRGR